MEFTALHKLCYQNTLDEWLIWWFLRRFTNMMLLMLSRSSAAVFQLLLLLVVFHSLLLFPPLLYCSPCQNIHGCLYEELLFPTSIFTDYPCKKCHICLYEIGCQGLGKNVCFFSFFFKNLQKRKKKAKECFASQIFHLYFIHLCRLSEAIKHFKNYRWAASAAGGTSFNLLLLTLQPRTHPVYGSNSSEFQRTLHSSALPPNSK